MDNTALVTPLMLAVIPVVIAVTELVKPVIGGSKYAPLFSLLLSLILVFLLPHDTNIGLTLIGGLVVATSANGLYGGTKKTMQTLAE